jgi:photosystem II stability/assembly factor-like uncharacterized protein
MVDSSISENQDIVYALAASPDFHRDGICFAARHSGLWRTSDGSNQWQAVSNIPFAPDSFIASAVAVSPHFQADGTVFAGVPGGILYSRDGGASWMIAHLQSPAPFISSLVFSPDYELDGTVFAATLEDGLFRTVDSGVTWQAWNFGLFDLGVLCIAVSPGYAQDKTVCIGTETGLFLSKNGGRAWQETSFPTDFAPVLSLGMSPQFMDDAILFAGTERCGLLYSDDCGKTWRQMLDSDGVSTICLSPDFPKTTDILVASNHILWQSRNGGDKWSQKMLDESSDATITAMTVPGGVTPTATVLIGLSNGKIIRV